jgi:hypothetical protein
MGARAEEWNRKLANDDDVGTGVEKGKLVAREMT